MTTTREPVIPGPNHPIEIKGFDGRVRVSFGHHTVAETTSALELREASYAPVYYVPMADVDHAALRPSETTSYCPYKGDASYYDVIDPHTLLAVDDAVWQYRTPYPFVDEIAEYVAFYPHKVDVEAQPAS